MTQHVRRPGGVTLLVVLGVIQGIAGFAAGLFLVLDRDDDDLIARSAMSSNALVLVGVVSMIVGVIMIALAMALSNGSNLVRWLFGIVTIVHVAGGVWGVFGLHGEQQLSAAFTVVFGLIILWILFGSERSDEFFAHG